MWHFQVCFDAELMSDIEECHHFAQFAQELGLCQSVTDIWRPISEKKTNKQSKTKNKRKKFAATFTEQKGKFARKVTILLHKKQFSLIINSLNC